MISRPWCRLSMCVVQENKQHCCRLPIICELKQVYLCELTCCNNNSLTKEQRALVYKLYPSSSKYTISRCQSNSGPDLLACPLTSTLIIPNLQDRICYFGAYYLPSVVMSELHTINLASVKACTHGRTHGHTPSEADFCVSASCLLISNQRVELNVAGADPEEGCQSQLGWCTGWPDDGWLTETSLLSLQVSSPINIHNLCCADYAVYIPTLMMTNINHIGHSVIRRPDQTELFFKEKKNVTDIL